MSKAQLDHLNRLKKQHKNAVEFRDRVIRLYNNPDFKEVILKFYMVNEVASFMEVAGSPVLPDRQRKDALDAAYAPGHLKRWLDARLSMGDNSETTLEEIEEAIIEEEAHPEGDDALGDDDDEDSGVPYGSMEVESDDEEGV